VLATYAYDNLGAPTSWTGPRFRYASAMSLPEAQHYHNARARQYAPGIGRFLQPDPILHAGGMNLYAYVANEGLKFLLGVVVFVVGVVILANGPRILGL
jgi:RHS repeat-associated protein